MEQSRSLSKPDKPLISRIMAARLGSKGGMFGLLLGWRLGVFAFDTLGVLGPEDAAAAA